MLKKNSLKQEYIRPTKRQIKTMESVKAGKSLFQSMLDGGYAPKTAVNAKQNLIESKGFQILIEKYREELRSLGVDIELMAKVQAKGLVDKDAKVRLDYLKEAKKDFGIYQPDNKSSNIVIGIGGFNKKDIEY